VHEHEAIAEIHKRLEKSKYAFFPVVNAQGKYLGLLTADIIQEASETQKPDKFVSNIVVAKDLLYRSGLKVPAILAEDSLTATAGIFAHFPCVPAVSEEGRVEGLLFVHSVRLAYDREVARRSLSVSPRLGASK
jgi:CBS domain-containing protein